MYSVLRSAKKCVTGLEQGYVTTWICNLGVTGSHPLTYKGKPSRLHIELGGQDLMQLSPQLRVIQIKSVEMHT